MCEEEAVRRVKQKTKQEPKKRPRTVRWILLAVLLVTVGLGVYQGGFDKGLHGIFDKGLPIKADLQFTEAVANRTTSKDGASLIQYRLKVDAKGWGNKMPDNASIVVIVDGVPHPVYGLQNITRGSGIFFIGAVPAKEGGSVVEFKIEADDADPGNNVRTVSVQ